MGSIALRPIGLALVGPLMTFVGIRDTLLGSAAIVVGATAAILAVPAIRRVHGDQEPPVDTGGPFAVVDISR
jgi:hypothetical protein